MANAKSHSELIFLAVAFFILFAVIMAGCSCASTEPVLVSTPDSDCKIYRYWSWYSERQDSFKVICQREPDPD